MAVTINPLGIYAYTTLAQRQVVVTPDDFENRGDWVLAATYSPMDVVTHQGALFICLTANTGIEPDGNIVTEEDDGSVTTVYWASMVLIDVTEAPEVDCCLVGSNALEIATSGSTLAQQAFDIAVTGTTDISGKVNRTGDTMSGTLQVPNLYYDVSNTNWSGTVVVDFSGDGYQDVVLSGDTHIHTANQALGRSTTLRLRNGPGGTRNLTFAQEITFLRTAPTGLAASKTAILSVSSFGSTEWDTVAAYAAQD